MTNYTPIKIAYNTFEPAIGIKDKLAPVIFLHGATCSKEMWDVIPQVIADKTKRRTYAYDARNHGESESTENFNFHLNADDLFQFMNELNIERAVLVGHSMGSFTSTIAALRKPERVEMIFSEDTFIKVIPKDIADYIIDYAMDLCEAVHSVSKDLSESEAFAEAEELFNKKNEIRGQFSSKESLKESKRVLKRRPDGGYDVAFNKDPIIRAFKDPETLYSNPSGQFNGPAYFIFGGESPFTGKSEEALIKKHFPKAEFIEIEGASHSLHLEFFDKFVEIILNRLQ